MSKNVHVSIRYNAVHRTVSIPMAFHLVSWSNSECQLGNWLDALCLQAFVCFEEVGPIWRRFSHLLSRDCLTALEESLTWQVNTFKFTCRSAQSFTLARKTPASITALMCRNQPEFSSPVRKSLIEGDFVSHTKNTNKRETLLTSPSSQPPHYPFTAVKVCRS